MKELLTFSPLLKFVVIIFHYVSGMSHRVCASECSALADQKKTSNSVEPFLSSEPREYGFLEGT